LRQTPRFWTLKFSNDKLSLTLANNLSKTQLTALVTRLYFLFAGLATYVSAGITAGHALLFQDHGVVLWNFKVRQDKQERKR